MLSCYEESFSDDITQVLVLLWMLLLVVYGCCYFVVVLYDCVSCICI